MRKKTAGRPLTNTTSGYTSEIFERRINPNLSKTILKSSNVDDTDNTPSTITWSTSNITTTLTQQGDGSSLPGFSVTVPTTSLSIKGASYEIQMKLSTDAWTINQTFTIYQPDSGDPTCSISPVIGSTTFTFRVRGVSSLGTVGAWSNEVNKTSTGDTTAPSAPTNLTATSITGGILLTWDRVTDSDLKNYAIYRNTSSSIPSTPTTYTDTTNYIDTGLDYDTTYYYWVKAVDYSGNKSSAAGYVSASPSKTMADDLISTMQKYNSDIEFSSDDSDGVSWTSGTIKFADGTTQSISSGSFSSLSSGTVYYIYFTTGSSSLSKTTTYSSCVSDTKGLLCTVAVSSDSESTEIGILPFYAKGENIISDFIAANAISALHIQTDSITADKVVNVGSSSTTGARIKMTQSTFRIYNSSSTSDSNYYPIELSTIGLYGYNWTSSSAKTTEFYISPSTGEFMSGGGDVVINTDGLSVHSSGDTDDTMRWYCGTYEIAYTWASRSSSTVGGFGIYSESNMSLTFKQFGSSYGQLILAAEHQIAMQSADSLSIQSTNSSIALVAYTTLGLQSTGIMSLNGLNSTTTIQFAYNSAQLAYFDSGGFIITSGKTFTLSSTGSDACDLWVSGSNLCYKTDGGTTKTLTGT